MDKSKQKHPQMSQEQLIFHQQNTSFVTGHDPQKRERKKRMNKNSVVREQDKERAEKKVAELAEKSMQVLFSARTVFPFDFFPDTLTINANKIDVTHCEFFLTNHTTSIPVRDIANVEVETIPFLATLRVINIRYPLQPVILRYLKREDAIKAKKIIDGLMVATSQGVDLADIEPAQFLEQIEQVGQGAREE